MVDWCIYGFYDDYMCSQSSVISGVAMSLAYTVYYCGIVQLYYGIVHNGIIMIFIMR